MSMLSRTDEMMLLAVWQLRKKAFYRRILKDSYFHTDFLLKCMFFRGIIVNEAAQRVEI